MRPFANLTALALAALSLAGCVVYEWVNPHPLPRGMGLEYPESERLGAESRAFIEEVLAPMPDPEGNTDHHLFLFLLHDSGDPVSERALRGITPIAEARRGESFALAALDVAQPLGRDLAEQVRFACDLFAVESLDEVPAPSAALFNRHGDVRARFHWSNPDSGVAFPETWHPTPEQIEEVVARRMRLPVSQW